MSDKKVFVNGAEEVPIEKKKLYDIMTIAEIRNIIIKKRKELKRSDK